MQRQLYPTLLLTSIGLAAAILMRPTLGREMLVLAQSYGQAGGAGAESDHAAVSAPAAYYSPPALQPYPEAVGSRHPTAPNPSAGYAYPVAGAGRPAPMLEPRYEGGIGRLEEQPNGPDSRQPGQGPSPPPNRGLLDAAEARMGLESPIVAEVKPCEGAQIMARVGSQVVLANEVMPSVEERLAALADRIPPGERQDVAKMATIASLSQVIERKLIYEDAKRKIPPEGLEHFRKRLGDYFDTEVLPKRMEAAKVTTRQELDESFQRIGSSLEQQKRAFIEQGTGEVWLRDRKTISSAVAPDELLEYYETHLDEFSTPARARWEGVMVRIPRYSDGSRARAKLGYLGNQVLRGATMDEAIRNQPRDGLECRGGTRGWVEQGKSQVSDVLEQALFGLPVGALSRILEDRDGLHIVRVLEREEGTREAFEDAQAKIRERIVEKRREEEQAKYLAELRSQIPVWTIFDDEPETAQLLREGPTRR